MAPVSRRDLLRGGAASLALSAAGCSIFGGDGGAKRLISRQETPLNAEADLDRLADASITSYRDMFVRSHGTMPEIDGVAWRLTIEGAVTRTVQFSLEDLLGMERVTVPATLVCAGNRRVEHHHVKPVSGVLWDAGAVGTPEWTGVRLADLLAWAGARPDAKVVWFEGRDVVALRDRQTLFGGQVPMAKATSPETLVVIGMNGRPLPREHGFPARVVVPGYIGARSVKWLHRIVVADRPSDNNFVANDYKLFPPDATPETVKPEQVEPIYENVLNSAICRPEAGETIGAGKVEVRGYAVPAGSPGAGISAVEVSPDGGATWVAAHLHGREGPYSWKLWRAEVDLTPGARTLVARATDLKGRMQPERCPWNFKGYLYNGWHRVPVTVA